MNSCAVTQYIGTINQSCFYLFRDKTIQGITIHTQYSGEMYVFMIFFLTILRSSLAFLPDPDNCCKTVKIKTNGEFTWLYDGDIYKLKGDYLENELEDSRIYYHVADEEWRISYIGYPERLSNSSQKCPENVEDWFGCSEEF